MTWFSNVRRQVEKKGARVHKDLQIAAVETWNRPQRRGAISNVLKHRLQYLVALGAVFVWFSPWVKKGLGSTQGWKEGTDRVGSVLMGEMLTLR